MSDVLIETTGATARITLNAPERLNAVNADMLAALDAAIAAADADPAVRVIVLTGAGRGFCSGANLGASREQMEDLDATLYAAGRLLRRITDAGTPTLAAVHGVAAGVGVSIALACDYALASDRASFVLAFTNIALMPDGGATELVAAAIGRARAMRLALAAEKLPAATAAEWGLVAECVPATDFDARLAAVAERLAWLGPEAAALTTRAINAATLDVESTLAREEEGQAGLLQSADFNEGVDAFLAKRPPTFGAR